MKEKINKQKKVTLFIISFVLFFVAILVVSRFEEKMLLEKKSAEMLSEKVIDHDFNEDLIVGNGDKMQVQVFFQNTSLANDPDMIDCSKVFPVVRTIDRVPGVAHQALQELILGPTEGERGAGYTSAISKEIGLHIDSVVLNDGVLSIFFNRAPFMGGSCALAGVVSQVHSTAKQFSSVKEVKMLVNGSEEWAQNP